jgi:hypothetical protein
MERVDSLHVADIAGAQAKPARVRTGPTSLVTRVGTAHRGRDAPTTRRRTNTCGEERHFRERQSVAKVRTPARGHARRTQHGTTAARAGTPPN